MRLFSICSIVSLLCSISMPGGHAMDSHTEMIVHNYVMDMPCNQSSAAVQDLFLNTTYLRLAAREWSSTHIISRWTSTNYSNVMDSVDASVKQHMFKYRFPRGTLHAQVQYDSEVNLPHILSPFMNTRVPLHINKHVYVVNSAMYTVTEITGLPVLGECVIFSRHVAAVDHKITSRNTVTYPEVPWYLKIVQSVIKLEMRNSLYDSRGR